MGIATLKRELRERILTYQYHLPGEGIWELLDTYDRYLEVSHTLSELAEAAFLRGEAAFHSGRYSDTVKALTKCITIEKTPDYLYLEADAYNMLGMLFSFVGYETVALNNYLAAIETAKRNQNHQAQVLTLLNIGILYQGLHDYRKAMTYYQRGYEAANSSLGVPQMFLMLLCMIQRAQLLCKMERYDEAKQMKKEIDAYYQATMQDEPLLSKYILEVWLETRFGTETKLVELIAQVRELLNTDTEYLEQIDFYVDFCGFLLQSGRVVETRQFIDTLKEKLGTTEFLHLQMQIEELEVLYQRQYGTEKKYFEACSHYIEIEQEYDRTLQIFKRQNLDTIENLQELERQQLEFEIRSKCDLATGLLNKQALQYEVEAYLADRNRDVTDAFIIIDIDDFKLINDSFGHLVGDEVIARLAELMKSVFCNGEICGRFGGDEFVVFLKAIDDLEDVETCVETFREDFSRIGFGKNGNIHNTISIGVSYNYDINASYTTMFSCADEALLKAKEYGKNRVAFFEIKRGLLKYV